MKGILVLIFLLSYSNFGFSQYAIYGSKSARQFGNAYNINGIAEDDGTAVSMKTLKSIARDNCAAPDCELIAEGNKGGWLSVLMGTNQSGQIIFITSDGNDNKVTAGQMVNQKYKQDGGIGEPIKISYFYVYTSNLPLDKLMQVSRNKQFTIRLPRNASTGYSWLAEVTDEFLLTDGATVKKVSINYSNPSGGGAGQMVGEAGTDIFTFNAVKKGASIIKFFLMPPGVTNAKKAEETKFYKVVVL